MCRLRRLPIPRLRQRPGLQDIQLGSSPAPASDAALAPEATIANSSLTPADEGLVPPAKVATKPQRIPLRRQLIRLRIQQRMRSYDEAFSALKDERYAESARRFKGFIDQYPNADLTGNAYYWPGWVSLRHPELSGGAGYLQRIADAFSGQPEGPGCLAQGGLLPVRAKT